MDLEANGGSELPQSTEEPAKRWEASNIFELIDCAIRRHLPNTAILGNELAITYGELDRRAGDLSEQLRRIGVGSETFVGICGERTSELLIALLGIVRAGGAYVPLDPAYPAERIQTILADAAPLALLTDPNRVGEFRGSNWVEIGRAAGTKGIALLSNGRIMTSVSMGLIKRWGHIFTIDI
jgi:non-ribosomal peptide synthetase component F